MAMQWYYSVGGQRCGPVSGAELKALAATGKVASTDLVWKDGMAEWVPASKVKGLIPPSETRGPPPLPLPGPPDLPFSGPSSTMESVLSRVPLLIAGLHRQRFAIAVAAGLGMLATFLPWAHVPIIGSVVGTAVNGWGWINLALFAPAMVLALRGDKILPLIGNQRLGAAIPAGLATLLGLGKLADFGPGMEFLQPGIGLYLLVLAGVALVAAAWLLARSAPPKKAEPTRIAPEVLHHFREVLPQSVESHTANPFKFDNAPDAPVVSLRPTNRRSNRGPWWYVSPGLLVIASFFSFLPWVEISCNSKEGPSLQSLVKQSGIQVAYGGISTSPFIDAAIEAQKKEQPEFREEADQPSLDERLKRIIKGDPISSEEVGELNCPSCKAKVRLKDRMFLEDQIECPMCRKSFDLPTDLKQRIGSKNQKKKRGPDWSPLITVSLFLNLTALGFAMMIQSGTARIILVGGCVAIALLLTGAQAVIGFPIEQAITKVDPQPDTEVGPDRLQRAIMLSAMIRIHYPLAFWLFISALVGVLVSFYAEKSYSMAKKTTPRA